MGGGVFLDSQNSKCQVLANFSFSGVGRGGGVFLGSQNSWQNEPNILEAKFWKPNLPTCVETNKPGPKGLRDSVGSGISN